jgi:hypothetical protein
MFLEWRLQGKALTDLRFTLPQLDGYSLKKRSIRVASNGGCSCIG